MEVYEYLMNKRMAGETLHFTLLDPDKLTAETAGDIAKRMASCGTDAFLIGGSTGVTKENLRMVVNAIHENTDLPAILFPSTGEAFCKELDAILFMSILNSSDHMYITGIHSVAAPFVKMLNVECISMGYVIVEPGMTVGRVTQANLIERDDNITAVGYAVTAEMLGMKTVYFEAGSGADKPIDPSMIADIRENIDIFLIVGGGIRTPEAAKAAHDAGANAIVTGTFVEQCKDDSVIKAVIKAAKGI